MCIYDIESVTNILGMTAATIGMCLSKSYLLMGTTQWLVQKSCECENNLTSVERVLEYTEMEDEENLEESTKKPEFNRKVAKGILFYHTKYH